MLLSADSILSMTEPGDLFTGDKDKIKAEYKNLITIWHPDHNKNDSKASKVTSHINTLYSKALKMLDEGRWEVPGLKSFKCIDGKIRNIRYKAIRDFELGTMYISTTKVVYVIPDKYYILFANATKVISTKFKFQDAKMKKEFSRYLPVIVDSFKTTENSLGLVLSSTPDLILLRDVLNHYNGKIPAKHVAWIINSLYNLVCYLNYTGLAHNAISPDTYFISPSLHGGVLTGGWWYAQVLGAKLSAVPTYTYRLVPPKVKDNKLATSQVDLELIRAVGRELLGDLNGTRLPDMKVAPEPMINWLRSPAGNNPIKEYIAWGKVIEKSFGPRKFIEMLVTPEMVYK